MDRDSKLTPNFALREFFVRTISGQRVFDQISWNYLWTRPDKYQQEILGNLKKTAKGLEQIRLKYGKPIYINSGYRCPQVNKEVGGEQPRGKSKGSYHLFGMAADIDIDGVGPAQIQHDYMGTWLGGLGSYATFTHIDNGPKRRWHG